MLHGNGILVCFSMMGYRFLLYAFFCCLCCRGQYLFEGQVSQALANRPVYLSLIEDYKKCSRIYLDQIVQKTVADSSGHFSFRGKSLPPKNRIYRIHVDGCQADDEFGHHLSKTCQQRQSILFIAKNNDTLLLDKTNGQEILCAVASTNDKAPLLLEINSLKEGLTYELSEINGQKGRDIILTDWFGRMHDFAIAANEPLAELYIHDFLSDRSNETYAHYLKDLQKSGYYKTLLKRLQSTYPKARFTKLYETQLAADTYILGQSRHTLSWSKWALYGALLLSLLLNLFLLLKWRANRQKVRPHSKLTAQEQKIIAEILKGKSNKAIAADLFISHSTVKTHINNLYKKLGVSSRQEILELYQ